MNKVDIVKCFFLLGGLGLIQPTIGFDLTQHKSITTRREALGSWLTKAATTTASVVLVSGGMTVASPSPAEAAASAVQDSLNVDDFLRTGLDTGGPMGVSSQAGKSKPETGIFLRDGSEVSRDPKSGNVLAEIILKSDSGDIMSALTTFSSPWPLAKGAYYDIECRDSKTGDGAFLSATTATGGKSIEQLTDSFFLDNLLAPTGRFSSYGPPTDVRVKKSAVNGDYKVMDITFSTLSQSTQTEIPRRARVVATIPKGSAQAVMLVGSALASRWNKKGSGQDILATTESFRAIAAPQTSLKLRKKDRSSSFLLD